jgi:hypothetical protein
VCRPFVQWFHSCIAPDVSVIVADAPSAISRTGAQHSAISSTLHGVARSHRAVGGRNGDPGADRSGDESGEAGCPGDGLNRPLRSATFGSMGRTVCHRHLSAPPPTRSLVTAGRQGSHVLTALGRCLWGDCRSGRRANDNQVRCGPRELVSVRRRDSLWAFATEDGKVELGGDGHARRRIRGDRYRVSRSRPAFVGYGRHRCEEG